VRSVPEIDRLARYPRSTGRGTLRPPARDADREVAKRFGQEYFDGTRDQGYGGYRYNARFWMGVAEDLRDAYGIGAGTRVLDVGCAKGFLLHDLRQVAPGVEVFGLDVSEYAIQNSMEDVRPRLARGTAERLPFPDAAFDVVLCINTIHNLLLDGCKQAIRELVRVTKPGGHSYIQVDSWLNEQQRIDFLNWQLTAQTFFAPEEWRALFAEGGYRGEYFWTLAE
jgi:ubiquinone/menaquinone biosynthesis C-methylase UbiE